MHGSKILFLVPYPLRESPSQRFRFEQYFQLLTETGYKYDVQSFLTAENWQLFYKPGNNLAKFVALLNGFVKRSFAILKSHKYDFIFIHREASPIGPPLLEWLLARVWKKKIIYDFDDAIWKTDRITEPGFLRLLKWRSKVASICAWSYKVSCGNAYLQQYARQFNSRAVINPTTIDTEHTHNRGLYRDHQKQANVTIGWTGTHSTLKYLKEIELVLFEILNQNPHVRVVIIADKKPDLKFEFTYMAWNKTTEIHDLLSFDIGVMPLPNDEWSQGKCGFKILQYMALQIPAVASPVGVNTEIIKDGISGFLCAQKDEWINKLIQLIKNEPLRNELGRAGGEVVQKRYSVLSNARNFLSLFE